MSDEVIAMKNIGAIFGVVTILAVLCLMTTNAQAARLDLETRSLKGIAGVYVVVEAPAPDLLADGLSDKALESMINERLTAAGINTLSENDLSKPGGAIFYVSINSVKSKSGQYACNIHAEVIQAASLSRDPNILTPATTWNSSTMGVMGSATVSKLNESVADITDEFIRDFLSMNARPVIKPKIA